MNTPGYEMKYVYHVVYMVEGDGLKRDVVTLPYMIYLGEDIDQLEEDYSKRIGKKVTVLNFILLNYEDNLR